MTTTISDWNGYEQVNFSVEGREGWFVRPETPAAGAPWVWRTRFFGAFDAVDRELLRRGWALAYYDIDGSEELMGAPLSLTRMEAFHRAMTEEFGFSPCPALFGFSRGGTYAINFANRCPDRVGALYLDAPLTNFRGFDRSKYQDLYDAALRNYGMTPEELRAFPDMPYTFAPALAKAGIPVVTVVGLSDTDVDYQENGKLFDEGFVAAGGTLLLFEKPGCAHHPHSFDDPPHVNEIASFIEKEYKR